MNPEDLPFDFSHLTAMVDAVTTELSGAATDLLRWLSLLSPGQKRQLWAALPSEAKADLQRLRNVP